MPTPPVSSTWPLWIDALVIAMRAKSGYRSPVDYSTVGVPVFDGPEIGLSGEDVSTYLVIGWSGDPDQPESPGNSVQEQATAGSSRNKDEKGVITCRAVCQLGDGDIASGAVKRARDGAFAMLADVELFVRASPNMALGLTGTVRLGQITSNRTEQWLNEGACCAVTFDIGYSSRI